jgi:hypothetical protein
MNISIDHYPVGATLILLIAAISTLGLWLWRRRLDLDTIRGYHEVAGYLLSVIGTMYAVLLGLVVVDAITKFQHAVNVTEQEANALADIFLLSNKMPPANRDKIQTLCLQYTDAVIDHEWATMVQSQVYLPARKTAITLIKEINDFEPQTEGQKAVYPLTVQAGCALWDNRRARTNFVTVGIPNVEWFVLIVGGIITIAFTYFFAMECLRTQMIMTGMLTTLISLNLYLIVLFGYPFSGDLHVGDDAFKVDQLIFKDQLGMAVPVEKT